MSALLQGGVGGVATQRRLASLEGGQRRVGTAGTGRQGERHRRAAHRHHVGHHSSALQPKRQVKLTLINSS